MQCIIPAKLLFHVSSFGISQGEESKDWKGRHELAAAADSSVWRCHRMRLLEADHIGILLRNAWGWCLEFDQAFQHLGLK